MADADEDLIHRGQSASEDTDLTEETQDFRFLASLSREDASIPKRGEKDFEPHATELQSNTLAASRLAMHNALSYQRVHQPKTHSIATYHPESNMAYAYKPKGPLFARMGSVLSARDDPIGDDEHRGQRIWLLPEEVLYLIERGTLDVRWPAVDDDESSIGLPMSLQGAYAMFIGEEAARRGGLTLEQYSVYAGLKRSGYTVLRAPSFNCPGSPPGEGCYAPMSKLPSRAWHVGLSTYYSSWFNMWSHRESYEEKTLRQAAGPLVSPGLYRNYSEIYRRLSLVPYHDPAARFGSLDKEEETDPDFRMTWHVWKPTSPFKKSAHGPPDFRIAVVNARDSMVPDLEQLAALMDTVPYNPPMDTAQLYQKLKHGYKSVILAIVDQGVVSYLRFSDAAFGREKLYERRGQGPGSKRGGRPGGRGRGR